VLEIRAVQRLAVSGEGVDPVAAVTHGGARDAGQR